MVLMLNPRVGLTVLTSSPMIFLTIVVLPALSRPLQVRCQIESGPRSKSKRKKELTVAYSIKMRSSLSLSLAFRRMESMVAVKRGGEGSGVGPGQMDRST